MLDSKIPHTSEYIHTIAFMLCKLKQLGLSAKYYKCLHGFCTGKVEGTHFMVVKCLLLFDLFKPQCACGSYLVKIPEYNVNNGVVKMMYCK